MDKNKKIPILLVDDEENFLERVRPVFEKRYEVKTATSGKEALEILRQGDFKPLVVLSDQMMPEMKGLELFENMVQEGMQYIGRILFTGYGEAEMAIEAFNQGLIGNYLQKPITRAKADLLFKYIDTAAEDAENHIHQGRKIEELRTSLAAAGRDATLGRLTEGIMGFFREAINSVLQRESIARHMVLKIREAHKNGASLDDETVQKALARIEETMESNRKTIGDISSVLHSTGGFAIALSRHREGYALKDILSAAVASVAKSAEMRNISLEFEKPDIDPFVSCIPSDIFLISVNLLLRALHLAGINGRVRVGLEQNNGRAVITFAHSGEHTPPLPENLFKEKISEYDMSLLPAVLEKYSGNINISAPEQGTTEIKIDFPLMPQS